MHLRRASRQEPVAISHHVRFVGEADDGVEQVRGRDAGARRAEHAELQGSSRTALEIPAGLVTVEMPIECGQSATYNSQSNVV